MARTSVTTEVQVSQCSTSPLPALFGYNYLLTRNKNVTANMQVFVDEFITRLAELHRSIDQKSLEG